ncbi:hypothetical protein U1Q18_001704 [Sarracenia purpurea var. burkii]
MQGFSTDRSKIGSCRGAGRRDSGRSIGEEIVGTAGCENQSKPEGAWLLISGDTNDPRGGEREACLPAVSGEEEDGFPAQHPGKNQRRKASHRSCRCFSCLNGEDEATGIA